MGTMNDGCVFCNIAAHEAEASIVYEDANVVTFMAAHPIRPGHVLVIPRIHVADLLDLDEDYELVFLAARQPRAS